MCPAAAPVAETTVTGSRADELRVAAGASVTAVGAGAGAASAVPSRSGATVTCEEGGAAGSRSRETSAALTWTSPLALPSSPGHTSCTLVTGRLTGRLDADRVAGGRVAVPAATTAVSVTTPTAGASRPLIASLPGGAAAGRRAAARPAPPAAAGPSPHDRRSRG